MSIQDLKDDVKTLDEKIDQLSIDVAVLNTSVKAMPKNLKNAVAVYMIGFIASISGGVLAAFIWVINSHIPALVNQIITKGVNS